MNRIGVFFYGVMAGAICILIYLRSITPEPQPPAVVIPTIVAPALPAAIIGPPAVPAPAAPSPVVAVETTPSPALPPATMALPEPAATVVAVIDQLLIPVAGISAGQLNDTFNETRGTDRRHEAIDILAARGTPVFAVADGKLVKLFDSKPGGLTIYQFDASEKFAYYYAHLERYAEGVKDGMLVRRGELIGYVGTTGNADPATPHLHFAIFVLGPEKQWWKGTPINPYSFLGGVKHS